MLQNSSNIQKEVGGGRASERHNWFMLLILPAWVFLGFFASELIVSLIIGLLSAVGVQFNLINESVLNATLAAIVYILTLSIVIFIPWVLKNIKINREDIGLSRLPSWGDIFITPAAFVVYIILSAALIMLIGSIFPGINTQQAQNTGFEHLARGYEYFLAFLTLVIVAPIAEEVLFRGYLFGKLKKYVPLWTAVLATSMLFGVFHGSWDVGIDTFALSVILCLLRETTGSIWSSILLHMLKNGIAFYLLFIYPTLLTTLVR